MNRRMKNKIEKMHRAKVHQMLDIVLDINGLGERKQSETGNLPTAFFEFSGHIAKARADVYIGGWKSEAKCVSHGFYTDDLLAAGGRQAAEKSIQSLIRLRDTLKERSDVHAV